MAGGKNVCDLFRMNDAGRVQVDVVTLDLGKARESAGGAAPAQRAAPKPSTRRAATGGGATR